MTALFQKPTTWFRAAAVVLILLLPLTALSAPPVSYSWSGVNENLVEVQAGTGAIAFDSAGIEFSTNSTAGATVITFASLAYAASAAFNLSFSPSARGGAYAVVGYQSPYNGTAYNLIISGATGQVSAETIDALGAVLTFAPVGLIDPTLSFQVVTNFLPPESAHFVLTQAANQVRIGLNNPTLFGTTPANLFIELTTISGAASLTVSSAEISVPAAGNPQYSATSAPLELQYGAIVALAILGFYDAIRRSVQASVARARRLPGEWRQVPLIIRVCALVALVALPIQVALMTWGSQPYDLFTQELWSYLGTHSGVVSIYSISQVVPGGKCCSSPSYIGSGFPYPPLSTYLFLGAGAISQALPGMSPIPSQNLGYLLKSFWLVVLDGVALVAALELRRAKVGDGWVVVAFTAVALNPGLLLGSVVWGTFDVVLALWLLLFLISIRRASWEWAWFFLFLAVLTKQDALLFLPLALPILFLRAGVWRAVRSASTALVAAFAVLLPLLVAGLSPAFVVNSTVGSNVFNVAATSPKNIPPWQLIVSSGDYGIWPLVTLLHNGQQGIARLQFPDYLPNQAFGLPYVDIGLGLAAAGILVLWVSLWRRARSPGFGYEWPVLLLVSFLWLFEVLTRLSARYLTLAIPLTIVLWASVETRRVGVLLTVALTAVCTLSLLSVLSLTAYQTPVSGLEGLGPLAPWFIANPFITGMSVAQLLVVAAAIACIASLLAAGRIPGAPHRPRSPPPPEILPAVPRVSVVILNYNGGGFGRACVDSVLASSHKNLEVLVVDNASRDSSLSLMADLEASGRIRIIRNQNNEGYARGNNAGGIVASGQLFLFLNNDTRVEPDSIARMVDHFRAHPATGAAQPLLVTMHDITRVSNAGNELDSLGFHEALGEGEPVQSIRVRSPTGYAQGSALMIRASLFRTIGGFDELLRFYQTDVDLCWEVWLTGHEVDVVDQARVLHDEGTTASAADLPARLPLLVHGQLVMVAKNYEVLNAIGAVSALVVTDMAISSLFLVLGRPREAKAIVRGVFEFLFELRKVREGRRAVARFRVATDLELRARFLRPFNPLSVLTSKRRGYGYAGERPFSRF
jgi:GT2 family glycosyltransferase